MSVTPPGRAAKESKTGIRIVVVLLIVTGIIVYVFIGSDFGLGLIAGIIVVLILMFFRPTSVVKTKSAPARKPP